MAMTHTYVMAHMIHIITYVMIWLMVVYIRMINEAMNANGKYDKNHVNQYADSDRPIIRMRPNSLSFFSVVIVCIINNAATAIPTTIATDRPTATTLSQSSSNDADTNEPLDR